MKVLYILIRDPDDSVKSIIKEQGKTCDITIVDIRADKRYEQIIDLIDRCDMVICW